MASRSQRLDREGSIHNPVATDGQRHDRIPQNVGQPGSGDNVSAGQKMLSALTGSLVTSFLVTPLDVVRVRLQSQQKVIQSVSRPPVSLPTAFANIPPNLGISTCCREVFWISSNSPYCVVSSPPASFPNHNAVVNRAIGAGSVKSLADCAVEEAQQRKFNGTYDAFRKIARSEGLPTLWRGLSPTLLMSIPANVIYFAGYDFLRHSPLSPIRRSDFVGDFYAPLIAGSTARVGAAIVVSPIELFRTRMQARSVSTQAPAGRGNGIIRQTADGVADLVRARGTRALWTGLSMTLWRDVPFSAIYWWGYEAGRDALVTVRERNQRQFADAHGDPDRTETLDEARLRENAGATLVDSFLAGAGSGAIAALVTQPFDVGKTRQQTVQHAPGATAQELKSAADNTMPRILRDLFMNEGFAGLYRGWAARLLKIAPSTAIMISTYELGKKWAARVNERREGLEDA